MTGLRTLTTSDLPALVTAFNDAFSDYAVPFSLTEEQLEEMLTRRGWAPSLSPALFEDDRIVAFTVNGFDGLTAYDSGTGVVRSHRRTGLARRLMEESFRLLSDAGADRYLLEVLEVNEAAEALYRALGFQERRRFQCWSFAPSDRRDADDVIGPVELPDVVEAGMYDVEPSWQNSLASIRRARAPRVTLGNDDAHAVVFLGNGDLPLLAVRRGARGRGLGRRLLEAAAAAAGKPLRILNVDARDLSIEAFLTACGASRTVRQIEMVKPLRRSG